MSVFFIFIDGIGVGENSTENPLSNRFLKSFSRFTGENGFHSGCKNVCSSRWLYRSIDANLGVEGYPQSGTGQTSLFTGINASKVIGKHFGPYPHTRIKPFLKDQSLFKKVMDIGCKPHFLNGYPDLFFEKSEKRNRWSCTTLMARSAGLKLNGIEEVKAGKAVTAEIVQSAWRDVLQLTVPEIEPETASDRALEALKEYDLVLYEYYLTDKAGHEKNHKMAGTVLQNLDRFMERILCSMDSNDTFVLTSDHGNLEDLSVKTHTRNPVPLMVSGETRFFRDAASILDVTPAILETLRSKE